MTVFSAENVSLFFGERELFSEVNFKIEHNDRIGLVGVNGCGKTSLLKQIKGEISCDSGGFVKSAESVLGFMEQYIIRDENVCVLDEALSIFAHLTELEHEIENIHQKIDNGNFTDSDLEMQMNLTQQFQDKGGLTFTSLTLSTLKGIGFSENDLSLPVSVLSGGQKSKLQLAKLLLSNADILLLDEPTNHLDINAVEWLERFLLEYKGAVFVISHDRYFLDKITSRTFEIENSRLKSYNGSYSQFLKLKESLLESIQKKYDDDIKEVHRMEEMIKRFKSFNREKSIKQAESKEKQLERMLVDIEKPPEKPKPLKFSFKTRIAGGNDVLFAENLNLSFGEKHLFSNVKIDIKRSERVFLIGANGCGKTSLFKLIRGDYPNIGGKIRFGTGVEISYYDQAQEGLNYNNTAIDEVWNKYPRMTETEIRNALAMFLFRGDDIYKKVIDLSGGEKARIALLKIMLKGSNFLLLDEPTNHLDITSREALENALLSYEGTLFIISHDRYLINKLATKLYFMSHNETQLINGNYDDYINLIENNQEISVNKAESTPKKVSDYKLKKEIQSEIRKLTTAVSRLESEITALEASIFYKNDQLSSEEFACDYEKAIELSSEIEQEGKKLKSLTDEWEKSSIKLEELESSQINERG